MYGDENSGQLPRYGRWWLWDIPRDTTTEIMEAMGLRTEEVCETQTEWNANGRDAPAPKVFYCPANITHKRYMQYCWDYHHPGGGWSDYRVFGYFLLFDWPGTPPDIEPPEDYKIWVGRCDVKNATDVELVTDVTLSDVDNPNYPAAEYPNGNFASIVSGSGGGAYSGQTDTTSHLRNDRAGAGGNIGFVDGHVDWRPFTQMKWRFKRGPVHWW